MFRRGGFPIHVRRGLVLTHRLPSVCLLYMSDYCQFYVRIFYILCSNVYVSIPLRQTNGLPRVGYMAHRVINTD